MDQQQPFHFNAVTSVPATTSGSNQVTATSGGSLLETRQQHAPYLQQLQVPSLPPLSQLLTEKRAAADQNVVAENDHPSLIAAEQHPAQQQITTNNNSLTNNSDNNSKSSSPATQLATSSTLPSALSHQDNPDNGHVSRSGASNYQQMIYNDYSLLSQPSMSPIMTSITQDPSSFINVLEQTTAPGFNPALLSSSTTAAANPTMYAAVAAAAAAGLTDPRHHLSMAAAVNGLVPPPSIEGGGEKGGGMSYNNSSSSMERQRQSSVSSCSSDKAYSFVAIPGANQKKRPRRRYDEIERLYHCNWPGCTKSYGTLNHLNAHVSMQQHVRKISHCNI
jgi:hypothetical protein